MIGSDIQRRAAKWLVICAALFASTEVHAETEEQKAITLFEKGRKLAREGHCDEAVDIFLQSLRHAEGVGPLLNLGNCYESLGKTASAHRYFRRAEEVASARQDAKRRDEAAQRATALEKEMASIVVHLPPSLRSPTVEVRLDGEPLPEAQLEKPTPVDPGAHEIKITDPPEARQQTALTVARGEHAEWTATVSAPPPVLAEASPPQSPAPPAEEKRPSSAQRTVAFVTGGVGLGALAASAIFGVISLSAHSSVIGRCPTYPTCSPDNRAELEDMNGNAKTAGNVATVNLVGGAVLLATAVVLLVTAPESADRR